MCVCVGGGGGGGGGGLRDNSKNLNPSYKAVEDFWLLWRGQPITLDWFRYMGSFLRRIFSELSSDQAISIS